MCARFLRIDGPHIDIPSNYTIYDADDQASLVKAALKELNLDATHYRPTAVATARRSPYTLAREDLAP